MARWLLGGAALFALAFAASAAFSGEYTSFVVAFTVFFGQTVTTQFIRLAKPATAPYLFTVQEIMSGIRPATPTAVAALLGAAVALMSAAAFWTERTDF